MNVYEVTKLLHPITTTPKKGVNVRELVKATFPKVYHYWGLFTFDWNDVDGVLDYLYGLVSLGYIDIKAVINLIEANCEVKQ